MLAITVNDSSQQNATCLPCCCEPLFLKPGTVTKVMVVYVPWSVPIGSLHCVPQFAIEQMETCPVLAGANMPPHIIAQDGMARFDTGTNVTLTADMKTKVADPEGLALTFKVMPLYGPKFGKLNLLSDGFFTYAPNPQFKGEERFFCTASDGVNSFTYETMIAVGIDAGLMAPAPHIFVGTPTINKQLHTVSFPVTLTPAADPCEVWRLTVLQAAIDCSCECYTRTDCFDVKVASC